MIRQIRKKCAAMELQSVQLIAGSISSLFFVSSNLPMLLKAFKTRNLRSYSLSNLLLTNLGNIFYWLYVSSLPIGPIWWMHSFYTITSILMLIAYIRYDGFGLRRTARRKGLLTLH